MTIHDGRLYKTKIVSIIKGTEGTPGEFIGTIDYQEKNFLGSIRVQILLPLVVKKLSFLLVQKVTLQSLEKML